jgi:hypothetical protein
MRNEMRRKKKIACHAVWRSFALVDQKRSGEAHRTAKEARGISESQSEKQVREKENEIFLVHESEVEPSSSDAETESSGKGVWYPVEFDRDIWSCFRAGIACQALGPGETVVGSLGTGKQSNWRRLNRWSRFSKFDIDALVTKEFHYLAPMEAPLPVSPQNGMRSEKWRQESSGLLGFVAWPEHCADATRFLGGCPIALTLLTPQTGTTMTDPSGIDHAHTAISFRTTLLRIEGETGGAL